MKLEALVSYIKDELLINCCPCTIKTVGLPVKFLYGHLILLILSGLQKLEHVSHSFLRPL